MTKDVMLHIVGRQAYSEEDDCKAEFFTEGKIFEKNNEVFVEYDETELAGFMGGHTILTIRDNEIIMSRANCESGAGDTRMEFMKGRRFNGSYETPAGVQEIEILANDLKVDMNKEKLTGNLNIDYNFSLKGLIEGRSILSIEITEKDFKKSRKF